MTNGASVSELVERMPHMRIWGVPEVRDHRPSLVRVYENLVLAYLASLLYVYPYGIPLGGEASIRMPDALGLGCLALGMAGLVLKQKLRTDPVFFIVVGPFVLLELITPVLGAIGYRQPVDVVSSLRMAMLWLPMLQLSMLAPPVREARFEQKLHRLLAVSLCLNLCYALVQIAVAVGLAPGWMAFTEFLEPFAVDRQFDVIMGLRPAGFFVNTTALAVFGTVCLCFFYAHYVAHRTSVDLLLSLGSIFLVVLTTSRAGFAAVVMIVAVGWFALTAGRKLAVLLVLAACVAGLLVLVEEIIGIERAFHRFNRVVESGLLADVSFGARINYIWPAALSTARDYPFGTLISAPRVVELIDSGYLTYYVQGKWLFVASVAFMLLGLWTIGLRRLRQSYLRPAGLMILFLGAYVTLSMTITNPMRSPLVISFIVFAFWKLKVERQSVWLLARVPPGEEVVECAPRA